MSRLAAIALAAAVSVLVGLSCAGGPPLVENATGAELYVEVVCSDGEIFSGSLAAGLHLGQRDVERLEIRRPDGSIQRYDRARLELLAKELPDRETVVWRIDADGLRAVPHSRWEQP